MFGILGIYVLALTAGQIDEPYAWPLDQPRALTSSFGEYRYDRFHMGIDLRTGPIGKNVYVAEDGYVSRIRCSPYGYGKAVYVQLDDGYTAVYAHLNDFIPELRDYVRRAQYDRKSYTVDLYPDPGQFRVERGQLIAYSGQTGIGVPHLHWEMRDRSGVPTSQRLLGLEWPDSTPPRFRKVIVVPADPQTRINGDILPVILNVRRTETGDYVTDPVQADGTVSFGVDVFDPANNGASKLGVHTIETRYGDESVYRMQHDRISYDDAPDGIVVYHPFYRSQGKFLMQAPWPGYDQSPLITGRGQGRITATEGTHDVNIQAWDFYEHDTTLTIPLTGVEYVEQAPDIEPADTGTGQVLYNPVGDWLVITVQFSSHESIPPVLLNDGDVVEDTAFHRINDRTFRAPFTGVSRDGHVRLSIDHPRAGADPETGALIEHEFWVVNDTARSTRLGAVSLDAQDAEPFSRVYLTLGETAARTSNELEPLGPAYQLWPERAPLRSAMKITLPWPEGQRPDGSGIGVYRKSGNDWSWISSTSSGTGITFESRQLGDFQIMRDSTPPTLSFSRPDSGAGMAPTERIELSLTDHGSSIDGWTAEFNGDWLLMGYDPETNKLFWEQDVPLPSGPGEIVVTAWDEAGNRRSVRRTVTVR